MGMLNFIAFSASPASINEAERPLDINHITAPMNKDAAKIFKNERAILLPSILLILFLNMISSIEKLKKAAHDVARASPPIFKGNINARFKKTFNTSDALATFTGVAVSCME